ncbi:MAG TPA: ABC transporter permease subunit, partial [Ilumatobacter sp.]|nr:ABC transporter permease subunit [Ilumatobacter sp.]
PDRRRFRIGPWLGLLPFLSFLFLFLLLPTYGVVKKAFSDETGAFSTSALTDVLSTERQAFYGSIKVSFVTALLGVVFGTMLAYAAATATRPKWLRSLVSAFSGVAANMGGVVLAFLFITLLGRQGLGTKLVREGLGFDLYNTSWFDISSFWGWVTVYMYFQIPLMVLVTLPAIDGLKPAWREASSNLGGTTWTYWRRVGLPVLAPSMLGGFLLLFANAFSAYATVYALNTQSNVMPVKISFGLRNDVGGRVTTPYALATCMIVVIAFAMGGYLMLRKRAERWQAI